MPKITANGLLVTAAASWVVIEAGMDLDGIVEGGLGALGQLGNAFMDGGIQSFVENLKGAAVDGTTGVS